MNDITRIDPRLPRLVVWLLEHLSAPHVREELVGDIEESLASRAGKGAVRNALWLTREIFCAPMTRLHQPVPRAFASSTGDSAMTSLQSDVQFAWRMLVRRPAFTALAVFTLALGIGATTAIFSAVNPILFESLPYPNSDRIAMIWEGRDANDPSNVGYSTYADIAEQNRSFAAVAAVGTATGTLTGRGEPQFLVGQRVTPSFFQVFGVQPAVGRAFSDAENVRGSERVVVLSHALWRNRFAGDSAIVGRTVAMLENDYRVLGVMPASFENVLGPTTHFYIPLRYDRTLPQACRSCRHLRAVALRKADVSETQAQRDLDNLAQRMGREYPTDYANASLRAANLSDDITRGVRPAMLAVLGAVALVLLVA